MKTNTTKTILKLAGMILRERALRDEITEIRLALNGDNFHSFSMNENEIQLNVNEETYKSLNPDGKPYLTVRPVFSIDPLTHLETGEAIGKCGRLRYPLFHVGMSGKQTVTISAMSESFDVKE